MEQPTIKKTMPLGFKKYGLEMGLTPQAKIVTITPEMAQSWLERNKTNRPLNQGNLKFIISEINSGNWGMSNDSISFDVDGNLINGQHRLTGVVITGKEIDSLVTTGMPSESFKIMDTGKNRSGADVLGIMGYKNYALLSATCSFVHRFNKSAGTAATQSGKGFSNSDLVKFVEDNPDICGVVNSASSIYNKSDKLLTASWLCALYFLFAQKSSIKKASEFIEKLSFGNNLSIDDPIWMLRKRLAKDKADKYNRMNKTMKLAMIIKAWNYSVSGVKVKKLSFKVGAEKFPQIKPVSDLDKSK